MYVWIRGAHRPSDLVHGQARDTDTCAASPSSRVVIGV